jgi:hypothetical protein
MLNEKDDNVHESTESESVEFEECGGRSWLVWLSCVRRMLLSHKAHDSSNIQRSPSHSDSHAQVPFLFICSKFDLCQGEID